MLRHPNNSGLQMDQVTRLYTPARYVDHFAVYQGDDLIFSVEGGISISQDPELPLQLCAERRQGHPRRSGRH